MLFGSYCARVAQSLLRQYSICMTQYKIRRTLVMCVCVCVCVCVYIMLLHLHLVKHSFVTFVFLSWKRYHSCVPTAIHSRDLSLHGLQKRWEILAKGSARLTIQQQQNTVLTITESTASFITKQKIVKIAICFNSTASLFIQVLKQ